MKTAHRFPLLLDLRLLICGLFAYPHAESGAGADPRRVGPASRASSAEFSK
jgi:hypothetical protein